MGIKSLWKDPDKKKKLIKSVKLIGNILCIVSVIFIVRYIWKLDIDWSVLLQPAVIIAVIVGGVMIGVEVFVNAFAWKSNLEMFTSDKIPLRDTVSVYGRSNIAKYIPGNFMHYVTRNILGSEYHLSQQHMAISTMLELILKIVVVFLLILCFAFSGLQTAIENMQQFMEPAFIIVGAIAVVAVVVGIILYMRKKGFLSQVKIKNVLVSCAGYAIVFVVNAAAFWIVAYVISPDIATSNPLLICGYYLIAWCVGYIMPGVPGGIGVREYVMLLLMGGMMGSEDISLIMIITRIVTVVGDVLAYLISMLVKRKGAEAPADEKAAA